MQYDFIKQSSPDDVRIRSATRSPSARLLDYARHLNVRSMEGYNPWEDHLGEGLNALHWSRPPEVRDFLGKTGNHRQQIQHPFDPKRRPGQPRVFFGLIASSNTLLKDAAKRDVLREQYNAKAIEMETAGLADAAWVQEVGYFGVRGICDYCDKKKNDEWQPYAAMAAAAYVRAHLVDPENPRPPSVTPGTTDSPRSGENKRARLSLNSKIALIAIMLMCGAVAAWMLGLTGPPLRNGQILVAKFEGPDEKYGFSSRILFKLPTFRTIPAAFF